jgi:hypothetical protein
MDVLSQQAATAFGMAYIYEQTTVQPRHPQDWNTFDYRPAKSLECERADVIIEDPFRRIRGFKPKGFK